MDSRDISAFGYRRIVLLLVSLVVVPTALSLVVGLVLLFLGEAQLNLLLGLLVLAFSGAAVTGVILVWVFVRREANLSQLQADFVSKVSHELRTPLTSIRMFAETLQMRRGDPHAEEQCIQGLSRESGRLQALIDRLLDWGRMESGRREYDMRRTAVRDVVETAAQDFEAERARANAELRLDIPDGLPLIDADRAAMADALVNLLSNAQKYGGDPPRIRVSAFAHERNVHLSVHDNGRGVPKSERKRIFYKFYRVDDRLSREREGSGLGLAIVKHVVKAHRGRVDVASSADGGSTFTLVLPSAGRESGGVA